jgi:hypothetical protein
LGLVGRDGQLGVLEYGWNLLGTNGSRQLFATLAATALAATLATSIVATATVSTATISATALSAAALIATISTTAISAADCAGRLFIRSTPGSHHHLRILV